MKASQPTILAMLALLACSKPEPEPAPPPPPPVATQTAAAASAAPVPPPAAPATAPPASEASAMAMGTTSATLATSSAAPSASTPLASVLHPDLLDPSKATAKAPSLFKTKFTTSKGTFVIEVHRDWSPNAADRFYNLVKLGFYDDTRFFRTVDGFMVQFGINGDPAVNAKWQEASIPDDPVTQSNKRGYVTFAQRNTPNTRTTQIFINYGDNSRLDGMRFAPFGQVISGMDVVDSFYKGYGGSPNQMLIQSQGNAYLDSHFPKLDSDKRAELLK